LNTPDCNMKTVMYKLLFFQSEASWIELSWCTSSREWLPGNQEITGKGIFPLFVEGTLKEMCIWDSVSTARVLIAWNFLSHYDIYSFSVCVCVCVFGGGGGGCPYISPLNKSLL
jgi:hypothetical protein